MPWQLSRFRTGDLVEVRSREEILTTLDTRGAVEGLPFMPEMLPFCGQQFRVSAVAHKTCETARRTWKGRRLARAVHLAGLRCNGAAHGDCQADCNFFWKDVWLKPVDESGPVRVSGAGCTESDLAASTRLADIDGEPVYSCQATRLFEATEALPWWDVRQYVFDIVTGNHTSDRVFRVTWLAFVRSLRDRMYRLPFGWRLYKPFHDWSHVQLTGRPAPDLQGKIKRGEPTPTGRLDLRPGELVRVKSKAEIEATIDESGKNRGLAFDGEEMASYCGGTFTVRTSVHRLIDEGNGKMLTMKQPGVILEGVVCQAEYSGCRLNCPRGLPSYWRELWLERVAPESRERVEPAVTSAV